MHPLKVYNGTPGTGPNPWKVAIVLEELGVPYEFVWMPYIELKQKPYTDLNPNGRFPTMADPNTDVTLFESGAIIQYIIAQYDKEHKLSYADDRLQDKWATDTWLMLQMSGQGPMFGQKMWFTHFHAQKDVASALERYANEVKRLMGVVEAHLGDKRKKLGLDAEAPVWLAGDKCTYADLSFVPWNVISRVALFPEGGLDEEKYPEYWKWHDNLVSRPATAGALKAREHAIATMKNSAAEVLPRRE